jgi:hypothetical protein
MNDHTTPHQPDHSTADSDAISYIRGRVDDLSKTVAEISHAVVQLARMEERMITLFDRMNTYDDKNETLSNRVQKIEVSLGTESVNERINKVERSVGTNGHTLRLAERLVWVIVTAGISYLFYVLR